MSTSEAFTVWYAMPWPQFCTFPFGVPFSREPRIFGSSSKFHQRKRVLAQLSPSIDSHVHINFRALSSWAFLSDPSSRRLPGGWTDANLPGYPASSRVPLVLMHSSWGDDRCVEVTCINVLKSTPLNTTTSTVNEGTNIVDRIFVWRHHVWTRVRCLPYTSMN